MSISILDPLAAVPKGGNGRPGQPEPQPAPSRPTVVLIDDSAAFLAAASQFIADFCGATVLATARSGEQGVQLVERAKPDVVLVDLNLPGMNGLDAARRIKALPDAPAVVMATLSAAVRAPGAESGCDGFVSKTQFTEQLPPLLRRLFEGKTG